MPEIGPGRGKKPDDSTPRDEGVFGHPPEGLRVALYARVSTAGQQTLGMQLDALDAYAERRGWTVVARVQEVESGAKRRPQRDALLEAARRRELDGILVWRLDRWGRSLPDLVLTLRELEALGVAFVSLTEALDLTTPTGRAMAGMVAVFAEFERDIRAERVRAGLDRARAEGRRLGRPPSARRRAAEVHELAAQGLTQAEIARRLDMGRSSVSRILRAADSSGAQKT